MSLAGAPDSTLTSVERKAWRTFRSIWQDATPAVQDRIRDLVGPAVVSKHHMRVVWRSASNDVRVEARRLVADSIETEEDFGNVYSRLPTAVRRSHEREVRLRTVGRRRPSKHRKPSGFTAPRHLSAELCAFLGVTTGTELPGSEVTRRIAQYIKEHKLGEGRNIHADAGLQALLRVPEGVTLSWFNIQHYLKNHLSRGTVA